MEDSLKGVLIALTISGLFMIAILNFIIMFPQEQGATFSDAPSQYNYLTTAGNVQNASNDMTDQLVDINNNTEKGFNQWDITVGFMGSNAVKQASSTGIKGYFSLIFNNLSILVTQVFGANSPVLYALAVLMSLGTAYLIYMVIKFIRTGN